jgi:hypothetical protein
MLFIPQRYVHTYSSYVLSKLNDTFWHSETILGNFTMISRCISGVTASVMNDRFEKAVDLKLRHQNVA